MTSLFSAVPRASKLNLMVKESMYAGTKSGSPIASSRVFPLRIKLLARFTSMSEPVSS